MSETNRMIHTPEGVRDIYTGECGRRLAVQERILKVLYSYGYEQIQTPSFEFMETFRQDRGSAGSREMFKFFDRDNNTLVLRPDMTPAIARCVAKYFKDETMPLRLCYLERTYKNNSSYQGRLKERTETGAELIGDNCADADGEMIALVTACLKASGLEEFQVELGQARFYQSLLEEAGLDEETEEELSRLIENKNPFGVEALLKERPMREELRRLFIRLPELFGTADEIRQVRTLTDNPKALEAVDRLLQVHQVIEACGLSRYVTYDLGMLSNYRYYTGIIFKAYTYGTGEYIATGGRYDGLLSKFGKDFPAIGFAILINVIAKRSILPFYFLGFFVVEIFSVSALQLACLGVPMVVAVVLMSKDAEENTVKRALQSSRGSMDDDDDDDVYAPLPQRFARNR